MDEQQLDNQELSSATVTPNKPVSQSNLSLVSLILLTFTVLAVGLAYLVFQNYMLNQKVDLLSINLSNQETEISPSPTNETFLDQPIGGTKPSQLNTALIQELREAGIANNTVQSPEYEAFIFADLTEEINSGRALKENIKPMLDQYSDRIKIWYIHSVLPYRDTPDLRAAIATNFCLSLQDAFWNNIDELIAADGSHAGNYFIEDKLEFINCVTDINKNTDYFDTKVATGLELMSKADVKAIPTVVFVKNSDLSAQKMVVGALPPQEYLNALDEL